MPPKSSITPLRNKNLKGKLYTRPEEIEAKLIQLANLSHEELVRRCEIREQDDLGYVPSECVLHFVRSYREKKDAADFERLYKILVERAVRNLPRAEGPDGKTVSLTISRVREHVFDRFLELLIIDHNGYSDKLDFYEIRFDAAMARLRANAFREVLPDAQRSEPIEVAPKTGELSGKVERSDSSFDPFNAAKLSSADYRSSLDAAIDVLTPENRRIIEMIRLGIPIDSKEPGVSTIAKILRKSEKTIRTRRDEAREQLRSWLTKGEQL